MQTSVKRFEITTTDGIVLRGEAFGDRVAKGTPVICLPGLTRTSRDFYALAERLAFDETNPRFVIVLNSRGRGPSDFDKNPENYNIFTEADDVLQVLTAAGLPKAIFVGTSRGGLLAIAAGIMRPGIIAGVVLNDIGAVIDTMGIARIKTYLTKTKPVITWEDAINFVKIANSGHFSNLSKEDWELLTHMTFKDEDGYPKADFDIHIVKSTEDLDLSQIPTDIWPQFLTLSHCPVLVIRGENSDILPQAAAEEMTRRHPDCQLYVAKNQGHAPLFIFDEICDQVVNFSAEVDQKQAQKQPRTTPEWLAEDEIVYIEPEQAKTETAEGLEEKNLTPI
ncbi:alpha/beta hydrolase [uncultured Cohaesibacter sp.]|uniref:alpha/beta fold hydrolase n=1 Tax=uncultured Cohaesibacter sp. TaxID=1002546 RepID=UPI002931EFE1|nr:alpha/beta hydrolase [uncultured Cohaesibacter sp.]